MRRKTIVKKYVVRTDVQRSRAHHQGLLEKNEFLQEIQQNLEQSIPKTLNYDDLPAILRGGQAVSSLKSSSNVVIDEKEIEVDDFIRTLTASSKILNEKMAAQIEQAIPALYRERNFTLLYSPTRDGTSLKTFYYKANERLPTLLVIEDTKGCIFGGYSATPWALSRDYYGTGQSFLFRFVVGSPFRPAELR
jgi:hypothetical protein